VVVLVLEHGAPLVGGQQLDRAARDVDPRAQKAGEDGLLRGVVDDVD
jgi:hypothetical protein